MDQKEFKQGELEVFMEALVTGNPGQAIINQEARGQQSFVNSATMPRSLGGKSNGEDSRDTLEKLGIVIAGESDDLFYDVTLPDGWKKIAEQHAMWSKLVDDKGRERASIFFKAAFYDRNAHMHLSNRYRATDEPVEGWDNYEYGKSPEMWVSRVYDQGQVIWESEPMHKEQGAGYKVSTIQRKQAEDWLNEHFPDWHNPFAYWD